ncbi:hypothetical protein Mal48_32890 [Thalassoglobus polymorphus]|uniref:Uncharacterized protein n=1 Tax=Thalassoglobus polymorphus TaxID=2527994 RepID=A0A517QQX8_9PLAN|nr:hypothetical protein Mal48_32890 [Thalassoglobus polymorphus]
MYNFEENRTNIVESGLPAAVEFRFKSPRKIARTVASSPFLVSLRKFYWTKLFPDQGLQLSRDCDKLRPEWEVQRLPSLR